MAWLPSVALGVALLAQGGQARAQVAGVAVVVMDPSAEAVAGHLDALVEGGVRRLPASGNPTIESLRRESLRRDGGDPRPVLVLVVDPRAASLRVLRLRDGLALYRAFDGATMASAPYAAAVAAVELLDIARGTPERLAVPAAPVVSAPAPPAPPAPLAPRLTVALSTGVSVARGLASDLRLVQADLGVEAAWGRRRGTWWVAAGVRVLPLGTDRQRVTSVDLFGRAPAEYDVTYDRLDGLAGLVVGRNLGRFALAAGPTLGFARITAAASAEGGQKFPARSDSEVAWGVGIAARARLWRGLFVLADAHGLRTPRPAQYLARGVPAYFEGQTALRVGLAIGWETGSPRDD